MNQRIDVMVDIETWGTGPDAVVRAVAAVAFAPWTGEVLDSAVWDLRGLIDRQLELGGTVDPDTVHWWGKMPDDGLGAYLRLARHMMPFTQPEGLDDAVSRIEGFIVSHSPRCCWSRGAFDYPILARLLDKQGVSPPWQFWQLRDVRTLDDLVPPIMPDRPHHPLSDCLAQIEQVRAALSLVPQPKAA